jgi:hypothetical protein
LPPVRLRFLFPAANSLHRDVSTSAFSSILLFLTGGTSSHIGDGWPTILKVVWATPFPESIPNGFRAVHFVCDDYLSSLKDTDIEVCFSQLSTSMAQLEDINIVLGSIGLP